MAVFNLKGNGIDLPNLRNRVFCKSLEKAGLRRIRLHDLKHTYATLRIQAGHNIADISEQLGHHSIKITVDTYYHYMPGEQNSEVNDLDSEIAPNCSLCATSHEEETKKGSAF